MKRFATVVIAAAMMIGGIGVASAQMHGSHGGSSGGSWHGGSGGGNWHGGGGNWHGGSWHGGHSHVFVGVGFGAPFWGWGWGWPGYYYPYAYSAYYPYYYDYPYGYDAGYSGSYIQQGAPAPAAPPAAARGEYSPQSQYSYYCPDPAGYYPQVPTCAKGWLRVVPQNAPGPTGPAAY